MSFWESFFEVNMDENKFRLWDTCIKCISAVFIVLSLVVATFQYKEKVENEYMAPIWLKQVHAYSKAASIASDAASTKANEEEKLKSHLDNLKNLYTAEILVVGDFTVVLPISVFIGSLESCIDKKNCSEESLRGLATAIARCSRKSLGKTWDRSFKDLSKTNPSTVKPDKMCK